MTATLKLAVIILVVAATHQPIFSAEAEGETSMMMVVEKHQAWMAEFGPRYKDGADRARRLMIFKDNLELIESFNSKNDKVAADDKSKSYWLRINEFADLTNAEFRCVRNKYKHNPDGARGRKTASFRYRNVSDDDIPHEIDWRDVGAVTPIKSQGSCGSCWAFSAVAALEGIHAFKTGNLISLSEQQLVDCDTSNIDHGCSGGFMESAFNYIVSNPIGGISSEDGNPYRAAQGTCYPKSIVAAAMITGYERVPPNDEAALRYAMAHQPVSVAIDASGYQFHCTGFQHSGTPNSSDRPCSAGGNLAIHFTCFSIIGLIEFSASTSPEDIG